MAAGAMKVLLWLLVASLNVICGATDGSVELSGFTLPPQMFSLLKEGGFFHPEDLDINEDCKSHMIAYNERLPWYFGKDMDDFWAAKSKST